MSVVEITDARTGSHARIAIAAGFNCFEFVARCNDTDVAAAKGVEHPNMSNSATVAIPSSNSQSDAKMALRGR